MSILVIAEHDNSSIKGATLNTVAAASALNGEVSLLVAGYDISGVIDECKKISGVSKILSCDNELYKNFLAEDFSKLVLSIADSYSYVLAPATTFGKI
jgi:electron transfer flavoprotein alpha subunit